MFTGFKNLDKKPRLRLGFLSRFLNPVNTRDSVCILYITSTVYSYRACDTVRSFGGSFVFSFARSFIVTKYVITYICGTFLAQIVTAWHPCPTSLLTGFRVHQLPHVSLYLGFPNALSQKAQLQGKHKMKHMTNFKTAKYSLFTDYQYLQDFKTSF